MIYTHTLTQARQQLATAKLFFYLKLNRHSSPQPAQPGLGRVSNAHITWLQPLVSPVSFSSPREKPKDFLALVRERETEVEGKNGEGEAKRATKRGEGESGETFQEETRKFGGGKVGGCLDGGRGREGRG